MSDTKDVLAALASIDDQRLGSYAIVTVDAARNLYAQFLADDSAGVRGELVGNTFLAPEDRLGASQQSQLRQRGWKGNGDRNWTKQWRDASTDEARRGIAMESLGTLAEVYAATGNVRVKINLKGLPEVLEAEATKATGNKLALFASALFLLMVGVALLLKFAG